MYWYFRPTNATLITFHEVYSKYIFGSMVYWMHQIEDTIVINSNVWPFSFSTLKILHTADSWTFAQHCSNAQVLCIKKKSHVKSKNFSIMWYFSIRILVVVSVTRIICTYLLNILRHERMLREKMSSLYKMCIVHIQTKVLAELIGFKIYDEHLRMLYYNSYC